MKSSYKASAIAVPQIRLALRSDLHLARKAWHCTMGMAIVLVYMLSGMSSSTGVAVLSSLLGLNLLIETARLRIPSVNERVVKIMGPLMRSSEETGLSGVPYYLASALLVIGLFPKTVAMLGLMYLAFGDPIASLFGILYGHKGPRFANGKSLIGTMAGVLACTAVTFAYLRILNYSAPEFGWIVVLGGIIGGTAEMIPLEIDDNFSVPILSGFGLWFVFLAFGI